MGWDYHTFENQPAYFIEEVSIIMFQEAQVSKLRAKKEEAKRKRSRKRK